MIALNPNMGGAIVDHLSALGQLPEAGYLAGQAVSSALFELFFDDSEGLVAYNDLDVFYQATRDDEEAVRRTRRGLKTVCYQDYFVHEDYGHLSLEVTGAYDIVRSHRSGLVNSIAYENLSYGPDSSQLHSLLKAFDLNCTQVGVSLATRRLEWTASFEQFVRTRQLQISNVQTPHHTAMRWFKKRRDLPAAYGRDDDAMELVSLLSVVKGGDDDSPVELSNVRWRFGKKNAALYSEFQRELSPYFDLAQDGEFFLLRSRQRPAEDVIEVARGYPARLFADVFNRVRSPQKAAKRRRVHAVLRPGPSGRRRELLMPLASYLQQGDGYLQGNVDVASLDRLATTHRVLVPTLWKLRATEQVEQYQAWSALERRFGQWIYGFVEAEGRALGRYGRMVGGLNAATWEYALEEYAARYVDVDTLLVAHKRFEATFGEYTVRELVTARELLEEGEALHHCVGGYAAEVRHGRSRILQVRHPTRVRWSTLELVPVTDSTRSAMRWTSAQHFSFRNEVVHEDNAAIVEAVLTALAFPVPIDDSSDTIVPSCEPDIAEPRVEFARLSELREERTPVLVKFVIACAKLISKALQWPRTLLRHLRGERALGPHRPRENDQAALEQAVMVFGPQAEAEDQRLFPRRRAGFR